MGHVQIVPGATESCSEAASGARSARCAQHAWSWSCRLM